MADRKTATVQIRDAAGMLVGEEDIWGYDDLNWDSLRKFIANAVIRAESVDSTTQEQT